MPKKKIHGAYNLSNCTLYNSGIQKTRTHISRRYVLLYYRQRFMLYNFLLSYATVFSAEDKFLVLEIRSTLLCAGLECV